MRAIRSLRDLVNELRKVFAAGDDTRLSNARVPTAHATSHAAAGTDPVTVAESQVSGLSTDLATIAANFDAVNESLSFKAPTDVPVFTGTVSLDRMTSGGDIQITDPLSGIVFLDKDDGNYKRVTMIRGVLTINDLGPTPPVV